MTQWQPISTAPKGPDEIDVLIYDQGHVYIASYWEGTGNWWVMSEFTVSDPSHWMPLPGPPEGEGL